MRVLSVGGISRFQFLITQPKGLADCWHSVFELPKPQNAGGIFGGTLIFHAHQTSLKSASYRLDSIETPGTIRFHDKRPSSRMAFRFFALAAHQSMFCGHRPDQALHHLL